LSEASGEAILVVDDDEMNRDMLSRRLARSGYAVTLAKDGLEALQRIDEQPFDLVLLDVMMPGMDGLQVLEQVRRTKSRSELPIVMATAKDASDDLVHALKLGANDYVTKPLDFPVVLARVQTQLSLRKARKELEAAHERMRRELQAAAKVQQALIPSHRPRIRGASFTWSYLPCTELAGDILDVFSLGERQAGLYLLDVSGHGVASALLSVSVSRALSPRTAGSLLHDPHGPESPEQRYLSPARVAARLNERFPMDSRTGQYFTFLYGVLDLETNQLRYAAAGHPGPLQVPRAGSALHHKGEGLPIGWFPNASYEERIVSLAPGDRLYFYSDGLPEAESLEGSFFGAPRLAETLERLRDRSLEESVDALVGELRSWCGDKGPADDVSLVALELER
jgi:sigma-B regulation protein RsbU (phosphoserine phosphatase)